MQKIVLGGRKEGGFGQKWLFFCRKIEKTLHDDFEKGGFSVHMSVLANLLIWGLQKNTIRIGKTVNFGNFRKMRPPLP